MKLQWFLHTFFIAFMGILRLEHKWYISLYIPAPNLALVLRTKLWMSLYIFCYNHTIIRWHILKNKNMDLIWQIWNVETRLKHRKFEFFIYMQKKICHYSSQNGLKQWKIVGYIFLRWNKTITLTAGIIATPLSTTCWSPQCTGVGSGRLCHPPCRWCSTPSLWCCRLSYLWFFAYI